MPYLGVNNSSNSVFKFFFIYKILVHQKKIRKMQKKQGFLFEDLNPYTLFGSEQPLGHHTQPNENNEVTF